MSRTPNTSSNYASGLYYIALYRAALSARIHPQAVHDAVQDGNLPVVTIYGCKYVTLADLVKLKAGAQ